MAKKRIGVKTIPICFLRERAISNKLHQQTCKEYTTKGETVFSVVGLRRLDIPAFIDQDVLSLEKVIISAGRLAMGIELKPSNLTIVMPNARIGDYCEE